MSDEGLAEAQEAEDREAAELRARIVAEPGLVLDDPDVMQALLSAHATEGGRKIVDLRGVLIERLESRLGDLEETHRSVISAAYENVAGANQIHRAALAVLSPRRFPEVLDVLLAEVPAMLSVEHLRLGLESDQPQGSAPEVIAPLPVGGVDAYLDLGREDSHRDVVLRRLPHGLPGAEAVFGEKAGEIGSEALIRLDFGKGVPPGLLAFGSADPDRFGPDQAGDLLAFFGGGVARTVRRWVA